MTKRFSKTSVQLPSEILEWLDGWPGITRSEALRLALERVQYLSSQMKNVEELVDKYKPVLAPALEEFRCENFRTVARSLPAIVGGYIEDGGSTESMDEFTRIGLDVSSLYKELVALHPVERIYLLDCIVARREWLKEPGSSPGPAPGTES
jgi:hypothetical protein